LPVCDPENLQQDMEVLEKHLEGMKSYLLMSEVADIVPNFATTLESFSTQFSLLKEDVDAAINTNKDEKFNKLKARVRE